MNKLMKKGDVVYFVKNGIRQGPFECRFNNPLRVFDETLAFSEGDKIIRVLPGGSEMTYTIVHVDFSSGLQTIKPHYIYTHQKDTSLMSSGKTTTNNITINSSNGIQIGDHNIQNLEVAMRDVLTAIENADAPREEKEEARNRLHKFLEHPLVVAAVGAAVPAAIGLMS
ncbi:RIP homotypic interaction motif (RHIM)-containing protein [Pseudomonas putida]|uniref:RIP homotypic interaction motif-containing protein n=1 Tax=Pseudomonas putida TaxID=303 RepID=UPI00104A4F6C|nr:RIP homotypic interaction motif-containing protein [Pseudomonas putida]TCP74092.1 RIP homotypic interaction motif (RHIM)-containing protein [Pseudomonas putida]